MDVIASESKSLDTVRTGDRKNEQGAWDRKPKPKPIVAVIWEGMNSRARTRQVRARVERVLRSGIQQLPGGKE